MNSGFARSLKFAAAATALLVLAGCQTTGGMLNPAAPAKVSQDERDRELRLAAAARSTGQHEAALGIYRNLLKAEPAAVDIQAALAETYFEQGQHPRALAAYNQALADGAAPPTVLAAAMIGRGRTLLAMSQPAAAEADFLSALAIAPANPVALNGQAVAADMQGRHGEAQRLYREALAVDPGNERVRSNLGLSYALAARFDDAVAELAPLTASANRAPKARHNLALAFGLMGRGEQAKQLTGGDLDQKTTESNDRFYKAIRDAVGVGPAAGEPRHAAPRPAAQPSPEAASRPVASAAPEPTAGPELAMATLKAPAPAEPEALDTQRDEATGATFFGPAFNLLETTTAR